jgi:hypothetical protein
MRYSIVFATGVLLALSGCGAERPSDLTATGQRRGDPVRLAGAELNVQAGAVDSVSLRVFAVSSDSMFWSSRSGPQAFRGRVREIRNATGVIVYSDTTSASESFRVFSPVSTSFTLLDSTARGFARIVASTTAGLSLASGAYDATIEVLVVGVTNTDLSNPRSVFFPIDASVRVNITK